MSASPPPSVTAPWSGGDVTPRAHCVLAPNPGPMTLDGTNTWVLVEPGSRSTQVLVPSSVIGPGFGARTQWARSVTPPPDQGAVTDGGGVALTSPSMPWGRAGRGQGRTVRSTSVPSSRRTSSGSTRATRGRSARKAAASAKAASRSSESR